MRARCRLLVLDIDGTLVPQNGGAADVADVDRAAVARARASGIAITLATGRLAPRALPIAHALGITLPIICVDGAALVAPDGAALGASRSFDALHVLATWALPTPAVAAFRAAAERAGLAAFALSPAAVLGVPGPAAAFLRGWAADVQPWDTPTPAGATSVAACLALGDEHAARATAHELASAAATRVATFPLGSGAPWAVRVSPAQADKAVATAYLAARLGLTAAQTCAVGDWHNDVGLLAWAGRSFAVADAPAEVLRAAGVVLGATSGSGGAVAEAIAVVLADDGVMR
jgi:hydroxymethylpyrimidine pyrophosphatase-like HAD family hydrolase